MQKPTKMKKASQYKNELAFFKLVRLCPDTLKMANIGEFPWSWIHRDRTQQKLVVVWLRPPYNVNMYTPPPPSSNAVVVHG